MKICIKGQRIESLSTPLIVADTVDYITAAFHFMTSDWDGLTKYAHFSNGSEKYDIKLIDDVISADKHLNFTAGEWMLWVHGESFENGKLKQRIPTNEVTFHVQSTGTTETGSPFPSAVPSITEQIMAKIGNLDRLETANKQTLVDAINEAFRTAGGEISPEQIAAAVEKYLEENPVEAISDHEELTGRDKANQHPISAIKELQATLDGKQPKGDYLTSDNLQSATNAALAQAKASGEFDGKDGEDGHTPVKGTDYFTKEDKAEIIEEVADTIDYDFLRNKPKINGIVLEGDVSSEELGIVGGGTTAGKTLPWENASPNSIFVANDSLHVKDMSNFKFLYVVCRVFHDPTNPSYRYKVCTEFPKELNKVGRCSYLSNSAGNMLYLYRDFEYINDTTLKVSSGSRLAQGSTAASVVDDFLIPEAIYGSN